MRVLLIGAEGFVGRYLFNALCRDNVEVFGGAFLFDSNDPFIKKHSGFIKFLDITKREDCINLITDVNPDIIVHLAAISFVPEGSEDPFNMINSNIYGTQNILSGISNLSKTCRIIFASSSEVYGPPERDQLITEETLPNPKSLYAITKLAGEYLCKGTAVPYTILRLFNHTGIGQRDTFVIPNFAKQIVKIEKSGQSDLMVGNLNVYKDFLDIEDVIRAYKAVIQFAKAGIYNVCSGKSRKLSEIVDFMINCSTRPLKIQTDNSRYRESTPNFWTASNHKFLNDFNWQLKENFNDTIIKLIDYFRNKEDIS